jgi:hypothetical protein
MCFEIDEQHKEKKIAEKDITCYKLIIKNQNELKTPFMGSVINFGDTVEAYLEIFKYFVEDGIHSYTSFGKAFAVKMRLITDGWASPGKLIIIKSVIPKGAEYFFNSYDKEYVSSKMIYGKKRTFFYNK